MRRLRRLVGARLVVLALVAAAAPLAFLASTVPAGKAQDATAEHPVIDSDFLYKELYDSSTRFIFRVAGADGPPTDPSNVNNLPQNYNGANEFYAWWKHEMTDTSNDHMGPLGRFATAKDHFEPCCSSSGNQTFPWQLDDATVTVPGQGCAGQVALISGHNDSTPTSTGVARMTTSASASGDGTRSSAASPGWRSGSESRNATCRPRRRNAMPIEPPMRPSPAISALASAPANRRLSASRLIPRIKRAPSAAESARVTWSQPGVSA